MINAGDMSKWESSNRAVEDGDGGVAYLKLLSLSLCAIKERKEKIILRKKINK